eukprot:GGOE01051509.1.p1 GENE.GGOE01051509.1~~GGOE01051509.1.p1  ORF type:complete len:284 (+),score=34.09 GGOE01051509.1:3-854(+)
MRECTFTPNRQGGHRRGSGRAGTLAQGNVPQASPSSAQSSSPGLTPLAEGRTPGSQPSTTPRRRVAGAAGKNLGGAFSRAEHGGLRPSAPEAKGVIQESTVEPLPTAEPTTQPVQENASEPLAEPQPEEETTIEVVPETASFPSADNGEGGSTAEEQGEILGHPEGVPHKDEGVQCEGLSPTDAATEPHQEHPAEASKPSAWEDEGGGCGGEAAADKEELDDVPPSAEGDQPSPGDIVQAMGAPEGNAAVNDGTDKDVCTQSEINTFEGDNDAPSTTPVHRGE